VGLIPYRGFESRPLRQHKCECPSSCDYHGRRAFAVALPEDTVRYVVSRISPWSGAKLGAVIGLVLGALLGVLIAAVYGSVAAELTYAGYDVGKVGWSGVALIALLGSMCFACAFPCIALLYNLASRIGAPLVVEITEEIAPKSDSSEETRNDSVYTDSSAPLLDLPLFDAE
jgi:hypothetical protein